MQHLGLEYEFGDFTFSPEYFDIYVENYYWYLEQLRLLISKYYNTNL